MTHHGKDHLHQGTDYLLPEATGFHEIKRLLEARYRLSEEPEGDWLQLNA